MFTEEDSQCQLLTNPGDLKSGKIRFSAKLQIQCKNLDKLPLLLFTQTLAITMVPIRITIVSCICMQSTLNTQQLHSMKATSPALAAQHIHAVPQLQPQPYLTNSLSEMLHRDAPYNYISNHRWPVCLEAWGCSKFCSILELSMSVLCVTRTTAGLAHPSIVC